MAISGNKWAIATRDQLLVTSNAPGLAANYKPNPNTYDALYVPRVSYNTGTLDIHDLSWAKGQTDCRQHTVLLPDGEQRRV